MSEQDPRAMWDRVNGHVRDRWREHVEEHLPARLLETLTGEPDEDGAD